MGDHVSSDKAHAFSRGRSVSHLFQSVSTTDLPPNDRYEHWADEVVRGVEILPANESQRRDFRASVTSLATQSGEMHYAVSDPYRIQLTRKTISKSSTAELALFLMVRWRLQYWYGDEPEQAVAEGEFFVLDGARPDTMDFSAHHFIQVDLSRPLLEASVPGALPSPVLLNKALAKSRLAGLLRNHLMQFPHRAQDMSAREQEALLDASESFAITTIAGAFASMEGIPDRTHAGLLIAAQRYVRRHLAVRNLNPAMIAAGVGCSRSLLYQVFSRNALTLQGYVRELRLQQFLRLLQNEARGESIQMLAPRCGLHDTPNVKGMSRPLRHEPQRGP
ncbi:hypothetical protein [Aquamicrobium sp.]|uniref:hypothetical protein n=1 Tax=Aquamicrobium sp. TaxID=1872579 RepID=UPI00258A8809|nr:hypothetical protein [Aquamicrobium sp.]MCK9551953.1 hypothetical protein [Aquamicrobium sp.]